MNNNNTDRYRAACSRIRAPEEWKRKTAARMEQAAARQHKRPPKWVWASTTAALLAGILLLSSVLRPTTAQAKENLMRGISPQKQEIPQTPSAEFVAAQADFGVKLLQKTAGEKQNALISPASVALALGMTANGAEKNTLSQFEALLGGGMDLGSLNRNFASERAAFQSAAGGKFLLANSIWYRDKNLTVKKPFLQTNADFFGAGAFQLDFSDPATAGKINSWVRENTEGKIDKMVEKIGPYDMMYLINTLYLEQDWEVPYRGSVKKAFRAPGGSRNVPMLNSSETYLHGEGAQGILKPLKNSRFAFAAILPDEKASSGAGDPGKLLSDYVAGFSDEKFLSLMRSAGKEKAGATLPKFKFDCDLPLKNALISLGLSDAFDKDKADFSAMGASPNGKLFVSDVLHKTFIEVDELGLKAGAATKVSMVSASAPMRRLVFDRPFLFAVVDTETLLPVFLGVVMDPSAG
jgi:serpin B